MIPEVRREAPEMIVGRDASFTKRWVGPRLEQTCARVLCWLFGHCWSSWSVDDYDGPGEELDGSGFMPFCRRESRPDEYGERCCERYCGTHERRFPVFDAPVEWVEKLMAEESR